MYDFNIDQIVTVLSLVTSVSGRGHISTIADPRMGKRVVENDGRKMAAQYIKWIRSFIDQV